jgi:uncharacterized membrane protein
MEMPMMSKKGKAAVVLGAGAAIGIAIGLARKAKGGESPPPQPPPGLASLYGVVKGESVSPLAGVSINLDGYSAMTDADGYFSLEVPPGYYSVAFEKQGYGGKEMGVTLSAGQQKQLNVSLVSIKAELYGQVTDADTGQPLSGVKVSIDSLSVYTDAAGMYGFTNLEPGTYDVKFEKSGYETAVK